MGFAGKFQSRNVDFIVSTVEEALMALSHERQKALDWWKRHRGKDELKSLLEGGDAPDQLHCQHIRKALGLITDEVSRHTRVRIIELRASIKTHLKRDCLRKPRDRPARTGKSSVFVR